MILHTHRQTALCRRQTLNDARLTVTLIVNCLIGFQTLYQVFGDPDVMLHGKVSFYTAALSSGSVDKAAFEDLKP